MWCYLLQNLFFKIFAVGWDLSYNLIYLLIASCRMLGLGTIVYICFADLQFVSSAFAFVQKNSIIYTWHLGSYSPPLLATGISSSRSPST